MPTRKPVDVWDAPADTPRIPASTPPAPAPAPALKPAPVAANFSVDAPPGPIQFEIRINNRTHFAQRIHSYTIDQTHPNHTTITAHLTPTDARND